jgi:hypothetical protein
MILRALLFVSSTFNDFSFSPPPPTVATTAVVLIVGVGLRWAVRKRFIEVLVGGGEMMGSGGG